VRLTECAVVCIVHVNVNVNVEETVTEGFESIPTAFATLFEGGNTGKMLVRAKL
jgi:NADPH-dependent curcumin reductase CurA